MRMISERWEKKLLRLLPALIYVYCILQPILDVIGYWQIIWKLSNAGTMAIRMILLAGSVLVGFLLSQRKRYYFIVGGILAGLTAMHIAANLPGYQEPVEDLINLVRIYLMPMTVLCFITFLRRGGDRAFRAMKNGMLINILIIVAVELLSVVTGTDRETYRHEHIGVLGWFFWANSQSAILSMMAPVVICWAVQKWPDKPLRIALFTVIAEGTLFAFGTRLTFAAMAATGVGVAVCLMIIDRKRWRQALVIFLVTAAFVGCFPLSPMAARMKAVKAMEHKNQTEIQKMEIDVSDLEKEDGKTEEAELSEESREQLHRLRKLYWKYIPGTVQRFGILRTAEKYNYTVNAATLGDWRIEKLYFSELVMKESSSMCRLFGVSLMDLREYVKNGVFNEDTGAWEDGYVNYDVENDFHGVYFLLGLVGLILMIGFLLFFALRPAYRVLRHFKTYFTVDLVAFAGAYVFGLLHAYFTVSVLRRNNASVYMAMVLVGLWYLSRKELASPSTANEKVADGRSPEEGDASREFPEPEEG